MDAQKSDLRSSWKELAQVFLKLGVLSYGGSAMIGIIQADVQEKRGWLSKERFLEGWALVNLLPGATLLQFCIFVGYVRAGWLGGILTGICFIVPALFIILALTIAYDAYGALPVLRYAFYGVGPVVLGFLTVAVYRLGKVALKGWKEALVAVASGAAVAFTPLGIVMTMLLAGCAGVVLYRSRIRGAVAAAVLLGIFALLHFGWVPAVGTGFFSGEAGTPPGAPNVWGVGGFFFKVGALTFGGGFTMLAFIQDQVVNQLHWLTSREFLDGLALGQVTPGPILIVAAYVGYKAAGVLGAVIAWFMIFLPAFLWMLAVLPILGRFNDQLWIKAAMRGISAAVIGIIAVYLVQLAPSAAPDLYTAGLGIITIAVLLWRPMGPLPLMLGGALIGAAIGVLHLGPWAG